MFVTRIKGMRGILERKHKEDARIVQAWIRGLKKAGLLLQRESMKLVPVDHGVLRGSAFTRVTGSGSKTDVQVGYTASYAIYVHENLDAAHGKQFNAKYRKEISSGQMRSRGPNQSAKFLEKPYKDPRIRSEMKAIVVAAVKLR